MSPVPSTHLRAGAGELRITAIGFAGNERALLETVVRLSQRRSPRLTLAPIELADHSDALVVDARNAAAMEQRRSVDPDGRKPCVLIDGTAGAGHEQAVARPVPWSLLPIILAKAMEGRNATAPLPARDTVEAGAQDADAHILVVDDSLAVRNFMESALHPSGAAVEFAASGDEALQLVRRRRFNCVFLDVIMPGMDGYQTCRQIKASAAGGKAPWVVMLTSRTSPFDKIRGAMAGCDAYLTKPVQPLKLLDALRRFGGVPSLAHAPMAPAGTPGFDSTLPLP